VKGFSLAGREATECGGYPMIRSARSGTTLKIRNRILNRPRKEYIARLKFSRAIGIHLLWVLYVSSGAKRKAMVHKVSKLPLIAVHQIKNVLSVWISMLLTLKFSLTRK
jgi:hypothetical protein